MFDFPLKIKSNPEIYKQLNYKDVLFTMFNCLLERKQEDLWSKYNYIAYVVSGRKIWHTQNNSFDLKEGDCVFVRKGANIVEQFFETDACFYLFFIPDEFLRDVLTSKTIPISNPKGKADLVIPIQNGKEIHSFFNSMSIYFDSPKEPEPSLLELKFKELILLIADNPLNKELLTYFSSIISKPRQLNLQEIMENNFSYNLKLEDYANLSARSLSAFKRDFIKIFETTPGKWLLERRLNHSYHLLKHKGKNVAEAAFESGFESASHFSRVFRTRFGITPNSLIQ